MKKVQKELQRFAKGILSKEQSVGTGILLALLVWTLTRIVDGVVASPAVEYDVSYGSSTLQGGGEAKIVIVVLTNLSRDKAFQNLELAVNDPKHKTQFVATEHDCAFPPPSWADDATCEANREGLNLIAPWLIPGTQIRATIKYQGSLEPSERPVVRIRPSASEDRVRLIEPGIQTFLARHEMALLVSLFLLTMVFLGVSIAAGVSAGPPKPTL